jgi:hypothetical protein
MGLPTREDLLQRKALEREEIERPRRRALAEERDLALACARYWSLLEEFVTRAREVGVEPCRRDTPAHGGHIPRLSWVEGYVLTSGDVVAAPPARYCVAERRHVLRPREEVHEVEELTLFSVSIRYESGLGADLEKHTASQGNWPAIDRLDRAAAVLTALERQLEASLLDLMD